MGQSQSATVPATDPARTSATPQPGDPFVIARGIFTGPDVSVDAGLYARVVTGSARCARETLTLAESARVDTNTYFGRVPASYLQRWTDVTEITLRLTYDTAGMALVQLRGCDCGGNERTLTTVEVVGSGTLQLSTPLSSYTDGGAIWVEFTAVDGSLTVTNLAWTAPRPDEVATASVVICTHNRPVDCANTIAALASDPVLLSGIDQVYVIDHGTKLVADEPRFHADREVLGDKLVYLRQPNLGGAGGFGRGMAEASAAFPDSHIILMDDDIRCEPESVLRLNAFANLTSTPTIVGAQMLYLMSPTYLHNGAERVDLRRLGAGLKAHRALHHVDLLETNQNWRVDADYNAWWTCLIPAPLINELGLPLPLFFQWDDAEYGIRAARAGYPTITLPNAAVWHADFYWKDDDDWSRFFSTRNGLIVAALHSDQDPKALAKVLGRKILHRIVALQYGLATTILDGIEAFLDGPSGLADGGQSALAAVVAARRDYPETRIQPAAHPEADGPSAARYAPPGVKPRADQADLVLAKRWVQQWRGRAVPGPVRIGFEDAFWWHTSLFNKTVVTDASQAGVRVRTFDPAVFRKLSRRTLTVLRRLRRDYPRVQAEYRAQASDLTSPTSWRCRFDNH